MQQPIISVYDKKTAIFERPFTVRHIGEAIREWDVVRKDPQTKFGKNPEDFSLHQIGYYDDSKGQFENITPHTHLADGV